MCADLEPQCEPPTGACCDWATGICTDDVFEADCQGTLEEWTDGVLCADLEPQCEPPTGACCDPATGNCEDLTEADCQYDWTDGVLCANLEPPCEAPLEELDFGDAPEEGEAYPSSGVIGKFPTCKTVGIPLNWIQHGLGLARFGPAWDSETDGNAGFCPGCFPTYDDDECFADGDAGLMGGSGLAEPYTINATGAVVTCNNSIGTPLGLTCQTATWGTDVDIFVVNNMPSEAVGYVNVLMDWNQDGQWAYNGSTTCTATPVPEHVLVNFPIPSGYGGLLSALGPPNFQIGPNPGYVWTRFTISERMVLDNNCVTHYSANPLSANNLGNNLNHGWNGEGIFEDGETEDYLLRVDEALPKMTIDKDTSTPIIVPGGTVTYTIDVTNADTATAINVSIFDTLPAWFTFATEDSIIATAGVTRYCAVSPTSPDTDLLWGYWDIPSGDSMVITFTANVDPDIPPGTYQNTAYADGDNFTQINDEEIEAGDPGTPGDQIDTGIDEDVEVEEQEEPPPTGVPTLSQWGMIAMGILFAAFLIWSVRRRWVVSADRS